MKLDKALQLATFSGKKDDVWERVQPRSHTSSFPLYQDVSHPSRNYAGRVGSLYVPWSGLPRG